MNKIETTIEQLVNNLIERFKTDEWEILYDFDFKIDDITFNSTLLSHIPGMSMLITNPDNGGRNVVTGMALQGANTIAEINWDGWVNSMKFHFKKLFNIYYTENSIISDIEFHSNERYLREGDNVFNNVF